MDFNHLQNRRLICRNELDNNENIQSAIVKLKKVYLTRSIFLITKKTLVNVKDALSFSYIFLQADIKEMMLQFQLFRLSSKAVVASSRQNFRGNK